MGRYRSFRDKLHYNPDYSVMSHSLSHCIEFGLEIMGGGGGVKQEIVCTYYMMMLRSRLMIP